MKLIWLGPSPHVHARLLSEGWRHITEGLYEYVRKDGKPGRLISVPQMGEKAPCDLCGLKLPHTQSRTDVWGWNFKGKKDYTTESKDWLCIGCWNKIRAIVKRKNEANELRILNNIFKKVINEKRKC